MANQVQILTLPQWAGGANWALELQHSCDSNTLLWQTRGQSRCIVEGQRRGLGVHNALVIPAGSLFSLELNKQNFGLVCLLPAGGSILMPDEPSLLRIREVQSQAELTSILEAMQREQNAQRDFADEAMNAHAALLTVWLRRAMISDERGETRRSAAERLVRAYSALIERDFKTGQPMAEYARNLGVTPTHLTRSCRQCAGLTAADLLIQRSLHAARMLLERGDRPVSQIAGELGFNSAAYFSRFVQHHTGLSPSALRKRARAAP